MRSFVGIDYSINKPAITLYFKGFFHFFFFPLSLKKKDIQAYANIKDVTCINRDLGIVDTTKLSMSSLAKEHTKRSIELSNLILDTLDQHLFLTKILNLVTAGFLLKVLLFLLQVMLHLTLLLIKVSS